MSEVKPKAKRKLPAGMKPWKKGQSGNPSGLSKDEQGFKQACADIATTHAYTVLVDYIKGIRRLIGWVRNEQGKLIQTDNEADVAIISCDEITQLKACQYVVDRAYGKAPQAVSVGGRDGGELTVHVIVKDVIAETLNGRNDRNS